MMSPRNRRWADDDGRTVADMSGVERPSLLLPRDQRKEPDKAPETERVQMARSERRAMLGGALSAGLLIGLIFAACFAILILLIQWIWR